jgi:hypothetical protein
MQPSDPCEYSKPKGYRGGERWFCGVAARRIFR